MLYFSHILCSDKAIQVTFFSLFDGTGKKHYWVHIWYKICIGLSAARKYIVFLLSCNGSSIPHPCFNEWMSEWWCYFRLLTKSEFWELQLIAWLTPLPTMMDPMSDSMTDLMINTIWLILWWVVLHSFKVYSKHHSLKGVDCLSFFGMFTNLCIKTMNVFGQDV